MTGNCIHEGFIRKVRTHRIGQIGTQGFLEFSDMIRAIYLYFISNLNIFNVVDYFRFSIEILDIKSTVSLVILDVKIISNFICT